MPKSEGEKGHRARHQLQPRRPRPRLYIPPAPRSSSSENSNSWYKKVKKDKYQNQEDHKDKDKNGEGLEGDSQLLQLRRIEEQRKTYYNRKKQIIYQDELCCILSETGGRCNELGVYKFNHFFEKMTIRKNLRLRADPRANHSFICGLHKKLIETAPYPEPNQSSSSNAKVEEESGPGTSGITRTEIGSNIQVQPTKTKTFRKSSHSKQFQQRGREGKGKIDWNVLDMNSLEKYVAVFKLEAPEVASKDCLIDIISRHFGTINVADHYQETIGEFIYKVKVKKEHWSKVFAYGEGCEKPTEI